jgi:hypothetical protein
MLKRTWSFLLVIALFAAPGAASAAGPDRATTDRGPSLMERVWDGIVRLLDVDGDGFRERIREPGGPRSVTANDEGGGHIDPNG